MAEAMAARVRVVRVEKASRVAEESVGQAAAVGQVGLEGLRVPGVHPLVLALNALDPAPFTSSPWRKANGRN